MFFHDLNGPGRIAYMGSGCVNCADVGLMNGGEPTGERDPTFLVPESATQHARTAPDRAVYQASTPSSDYSFSTFGGISQPPGFSTDGLVIVGTGPEGGATIVEVTLPAKEHDLAGRILNSAIR